MTDYDLPYTTEELPNSTLESMSLPNQIRYAVYNGRDTPTDVAAVTTYPEDWTAEMLHDLAAFDGVLVEHGDGSYSIHDDELPDESEDEDDLVPIEELTEPEDDDTPDDADGEQAGVEPEPDAEPAQASLDDATAGAVDAPDLPTPETEPAADLVSIDDDTLDAEPADPADVLDAREEHGGSLPVDRDYDWEEETVYREHVDEYVSANGEYEDILREIRSREETGKLAHFRICGPSGCGKTSIAENAAVELDGEHSRPVPVFEIQCHDGLRPSNLLGMPTYVGDETWWTDGPLTKALISSRHQPTVLILDEVNRTTARTLGVVMSALDHQCRVTLNSRGGEVIEGNPLNLIVFSTMNEGEGYITNQLDNAQVRRLGNTFYTDYIGMHDVDEEAKLVAERTPISKNVAVEMIAAANDIREKTSDRDSAIKMGVPTSTMLDWARTAWSYRKSAGSEGPVMKAARRSVINAFFRTDENIKNTVETTIDSHVHGLTLDYDEDLRDLTVVDGVGSTKADALTDAGFDDVGDLQKSTQEELAEVDGIGSAMAARIKADVGEPPEDEDDADADVDATWLVCSGCGWHATTEDAEAEVVTTMECPDCDDTLTPKEDLDA